MPPHSEPLALKFLDLGQDGFWTHSYGLCGNSVVKTMRSSLLAPLEEAVFTRTYDSTYYAVRYEVLKSLEWGLGG